MSEENIPNQEMQDEEAEEKVVIPFKPYPVHVLSIVKSAQNQNGLRHNDYARYHHYCVRKVQRLRKALKFVQQQGNKKDVKQEYIKKNVTQVEGQEMQDVGGTVAGEKYLLIMIFQCEADWAYAMDMKKALSNQEGGPKAEESKAGLKNQSQLNQKSVHAARLSSRLKIHAKKRFGKAFKHAQSLLKVAEQCLDGFSKYEMQAYVESMQSAYLIEAEKWQQALDRLVSAKLIYQNISSFKDSIEAVIYGEKTSQLDTFIRLCCLNLSMKTSASLEEKIQSKLKVSIESAHKETKQEQIENIQQIIFNGKTIPLKSERIKIIFKKVENKLNDIQMKEKDCNVPQEIIKDYLDFMNILDDATLIIRKEKAEETKKSEQSGQVYNILLQYTQRLKQKSSIDRNLLQAKILEKKFNLEQLLNFMSGKEKSALCTVRAQNIVRFYEKAIKAQKSSAENKDQDPQAIIKNEFQEKWQTINIQYYIALHYIQEHNQYKQAMVILQQTLSLIEEFIDFTNQHSLQEPQTKVVLKNVELVLSKCHAKYLMNEAENAKDTVMTVDTAKNEKVIEYDNLYERLFDDKLQLKSVDNSQKQVAIGNDQALINFLEAGLSIDNKQELDQVDISKLKVNKQYKLINPLPKLKSVAATPQFFDMAGGYIQYPDAATEAKKYEAQGGMFSSIAGYFGR